MVGLDERAEIWQARRIKRTKMSLTPLGKREEPNVSDRNAEYYHIKKYTFSHRNMEGT
jgi:hypothetical protein